MDDYLFFFGVFVSILFLIGLYHTVKEFRNVSEDHQRKFYEERDQSKMRVDK